MLKTLNGVRFAMDTDNGDVYMIDSTGKATKLTDRLALQSTECTVTAFSLSGNPGEGISVYSADGVIDEENRTITCTFTDSNAVAPMPTLAASWTASAHAKLYVGGVEQVAGTANGTYNDYNGGAVSFVVTAQDGVTTKSYAVTAVPYGA